MRLAVIPARGGSKRIHKKNIRDFCGKPIITWSIDAAKKSKLFDKIIVSTDDEEIAKIAKKNKVEVPFLRPKYLSDDYTETLPVIEHALNWYLKKDYIISDVCCIYATAPFIRSIDLIKGLELLNCMNANFCFSVTSYPFPIQRALTLSLDGRIEMINHSYYSKRSQDLVEHYHDAGQFYWGKTHAWLSKEPIFGKNSVPYILPRYRVQDIDTHEDWKQAEIIFKMLSRQKKEK